MTDPIVEVYAAANVQQAHLVKAALADAGIEAQVVGDQLSGAVADLPLGFETAPQIWVQQADAERARQVVADFEAVTSPDRPEVESPPWKCPNCGTEVEGNFDVCWECQHARPE